MAKLNVVDVNGKKVGDITLSDEIFGIEPNEFAVQAVVRNYLPTVEGKAHPGFLGWMQWNH